MKIFFFAMLQNIACKLSYPKQIIFNFGQTVLISQFFYIAFIRALIYRIGSQPQRGFSLANLFLLNINIFRFDFLHKTNAPKFFERVSNQHCGEVLVDLAQKNNAIDDVITAIALNKKQQKNKRNPNQTRFLCPSFIWGNLEDRVSEICVFDVVKIIIALQNKIDSIV